MAKGSRKNIFVSLLIVAALSLLVLWWFREGRDPLDRFAADLDSLISPQRIERQIGVLASKPHRAGSPENKAVGDAILQRLEQAGLRTSTVEYLVDLPEPVETCLLLTYPETIELDLHEKFLKEDPYTKAAAAEIPFFAYSPDCDLEAEVVYANFGAREDYALLRSRGITIAGKIAVVRAQGICRSMKALIAEEEGVAGLLLFPELRDQGFTKSPYPQGSHINQWTVQRGSMLKYFICPGAPKKAGSDSPVPDARPCAPTSTAPTVPALPISQETAMQILQRIEGAPPPPDWRGFLPVSYALGSGPARVRMSYRSTSRAKTIKNILAVIQGSNELEPGVLVGSHYDAWVYGAADPSSGAAVLLETADSLMTLRKNGWMPNRNITFAFWDGEEFGMHGSTAWVMQNLKKIQGGTAAYLNVDTAVKGRDFAGYITPGLQHALDEVLTRVKDPTTGKTLFDLRGEYQHPGFSSDTAPFTGFAGIPAAEIQFGRSYGMYHSLYDDLMWMRKFGDPNYRYCATLSKVLSLYLIRLAGSQILPYSFSELSSHAFQTLDEMQIERQSPLIQNLVKEIRSFDRVAQQWDRIRNRNPKGNASKINRLLLQAIASFVRSDVPFERRNILMGPAEMSGCRGELLPGLQRAVRAQDSSRMAEETESLIHAFSQARQLLQEAQTLL